MESFTKLTFQNFDLLSVGIAISAIGLLSLIIWYHDRRGAINRVFLFMCLSAMVWSLFNYLSYQIRDGYIALWFLRVAIFFAVWFSYFIYRLFSQFSLPEDERTPLIHKGLAVLSGVTSLLNLTPLVFKQVAELSTTGRISKIINGPGILLFALTVFGLITFGILLIVHKIRHSQKQEKNQLILVLLGLSVTSGLLVIFNFLLPAFFDNPRYLPLGALFLFPFIAFTSYAIFKHRLFDVKVIATEIFTFLLAVISLFELIASNDTGIIIFRGSIFLLIIALGGLLIRSVRREVEQKEKLQALTGQLKRANNQLQALDIARAEFISIASHQLRTPPATIKWYLGAILSGDYGELHDDVKKALEKAQATNNNLIASIEDMLNVSRIERGKMEFLFEKCDLMPIAQQTFEQLVPIAQEKKLLFLFNKPEKPLPEVMADKEKIRQVMNNLMDNAIKYTKQGSVLVEMYQEDGSVRFQVTDTGRGIGSSERKDIFQKFKRGKESLKQSAGLGLGLYVARIIMEQHKGKIWVESKGEGKGSTFIFTLPLKNNLKTTTLLTLGN